MSVKYKSQKSEPITSYGMININLSGELKEYENNIKSAFTKNTHVDILSLAVDDNDDYRNIYNMVQKNLLFLLISRKHSLGYIEFIRGRYDISDNSTIEHLFVQMTENEIYNIFEIPFDTLWCILWKKNAKKNTYNKEYVTASEKYEYVISTYNINDFKPKYPTKEWGFPKGRKNNGETNINCALRECSEETTLCRSEMHILTGISPLVEEMTGTNNVQYRHIYYLSIIDNIRNLSIENDTIQFAEIDTAGWFKKERILNLIRPYHKEKIDIVNQIISFIAYTVYCVEQK